MPQDRRHINFVLSKDLEEPFYSLVESEGTNKSDLMNKCVREYIEGGNELLDGVRKAVREELAQAGVVRSADLQVAAGALREALEAQVVDVPPSLPAAEREAATKSGKAEGYAEGIKAAREEYSRDLDALRAERDEARKEKKEAEEAARQEEREKIAAMGWASRRRYLNGRQ